MVCLQVKQIEGFERRTATPQQYVNVNFSDSFRHPCLTPSLSHKHTRTHECKSLDFVFKGLMLHLWLLNGSLTDPCDWFCAEFCCYLYAFCILWVNWAGYCIYMWQSIRVRTAVGGVVFNSVALKWGCSGFQSTGRLLPFCEEFACLSHAGFLLVLWFPPTV